MKQRLALALLALIFAAAVPITANAAVTLKPIKTCPVKADATFRVIGARGERDGVGSEYQWLALKRPGWQRDEQILLEGPRGTAWDVLSISKGRQRQQICFDITGFFGKSP